MKAEKCQVKECGARVYWVRVDDVRLAVDPTLVQVVVPEGGGGGFRLITGYRPHHLSCVDLEGRIEHLRQISSVTVLGEQVGQHDQ